MRVWGIMLAKNEADIIGTTLRHHMALGLSGIVVFDNMSNDNTGDVARAVPGTVVLEDSDPAFRQGRKNRDMTEIAMDHGAEWIVAIDADELWCPTRAATIPDAIADLGNDCFRARILDHVCSEFDDESEINPVLRMRWRRRKLGVGKAAHRCEPGTHVWGGNEGLLRGGVVVEPPIRGRMLIRHYPVRGLKHLKRKAAFGWRAVNNQDGVHRKACAHWRKWYIRMRENPTGFKDYYHRKILLTERRLTREPGAWVEDPFIPAHMA